MTFEIPPGEQLGLKVWCRPDKTTVVVVYKTRYVTEMEDRSVRTPAPSPGGDLRPIEEFSQRDTSGENKTGRAQKEKPPAQAGVNKKKTVPQKRQGARRRTAPEDYTPGFLKFWRDISPRWDSSRRGSRRPAFRAWWHWTQTKKVPETVLFAACLRYIAHCKRTDQAFKHISTFLSVRDEHWKDWTGAGGSGEKPDQGEEWDEL